jgi:3-deoxy-manno-octulosonate cytidylyltransferase (CMP-KDO synthetase)
MTSPDHYSGTDRVAEAVRRLEERSEEISIAVNIQGDEVLVDPEALDALVQAFGDDPSLEYATIAEPFLTPNDVLDPNTCKVVLDAAGNALYFSRSPIPFLRSVTPSGIEPIASALASKTGALTGYLRHVGIYGFRRGALTEFSRLPAGKLEAIEGLEQLRLLESGRRLRVVVSRSVTLDVDTPADLEMVKEILARERLHAS